MVVDMRLAVFVCLSLLVAVCGCTGVNNEGAPTPAPMPTTQPLPTAGPLPTMPPATITPVPPAANDPIVGTWSWYGANNTMSTYDFHADGTFERQDSDTTQAFTGVWQRQGPDTYLLVYNTPTPGVATETVTYYPSLSRLGNEEQNYYTRA